MAEDDRYPSQLAERFQVRLPDGMRDRLKAEAEANKRSMNAEIVARLNSTLSHAHISNKPGEPLELDALIEAAANRIVERAEVIAEEKRLFPKFRPHLSFSYEDPVDKERKVVFFEYERSMNEVERAIDELKRYAKFNTATGMGIIIHDGGLISFDPHTGSEISFTEIVEIFDMFAKAYNIDLRKVMIDRNERLKFLDTTRY